MQCFVYKSALQQDHYVYTPVQLDADPSKHLPIALVQLLGELHLVLDLQLDSDTKLAQANAADVIRDIQQQGFYLQMPKKDWQQLEDQYFN